jgi:hypothetical protein
MKGRITSRKRDKDGNPIGLAYSNPILDMCKYTFTFNDGDETVLNANLIAEAMYAHVTLTGTNMFSLTLLLTTNDLTLQLDPQTKRWSDPTGVHT